MGMPFVLTSIVGTPRQRSNFLARAESGRGLASVSLAIGRPRVEYPDDIEELDEAELDRLHDPWKDLSDQDAVNFRLLGQLNIFFSFVALSVVAFASLNALLVKYDIAGTLEPPPEDGRALFTDAALTQLVALLKAVPLLDLPSSLRLDAPLTYTDRWTGAVEIAFTLMVIAPLVPVVTLAMRDRTSGRNG